MTWWDVLDIVIIAIAVYEILKALRGTRAIQMAFASAYPRGHVLSLAVGQPQNGRLVIQNLFGYIVFARSCSSGGHPPRAGTLRPGAVLPIFPAALPEGAEGTIEELVVAASQLQLSLSGSAPSS